MKIKIGQKIKLRGWSGPFSRVPILGIKANGDVICRNPNGKTINICRDRIRKNGRGLREVGSW